MGDSEHPESLLPDEIRHVVWEHPEVNPTIRTRTKAIQFWMISYPPNTPIHLVLESPSQPGTGIFVKGNRINELPLRLLDKADDHGTKRCSAARITSS